MIGPDAVVVTEAQDHIVDVGPHRLTDGGNGVGEREFGDQEGVGGVLDGLGRRRVCEHHWSIDSVVQRPYDLTGPVVVGTDHDPVGSQKVGYCCALTQELRVRGHADVIPVE